MCRTRPSSVSPDGGTACSLSCSAVRPEHLLSKVSRCQSSQASSVSRSPATRGGSGRFTSGAVHVTQTSSAPGLLAATQIPAPGGGPDHPAPEPCAALHRLGHLGRGGG